MKGLLLKDYYVMLKNCRAFLPLVVVFLAVSILNPQSSFFRYYTAIIVGMMSLSLLSFDERDGWERTCIMFPYTRTQMVSGKYLFGLILVLLLSVVSGVATAAAGISAGTLVWQRVLRDTAVMVAAGVMAPAFVLPFSFKFGTEKGRIAYYAAIVLICAVMGMIAIGVEKGGGNRIIQMLLSENAVYGYMAASLLVYIVSWLLSVCFYKKREL